MCYAYALRVESGATGFRCVMKKRGLEEDIFIRLSLKLVLVGILYYLKLRGVGGGSSDNLIGQVFVVEWL